MKKVLSLTLALVMVLGMSTVAFAAAGTYIPETAGTEGGALAGAPMSQDETDWGFARVTDWRSGSGTDVADEDLRVSGYDTLTDLPATKYGPGDSIRFVPYDKTGDQWLSKDSKIAMTMRKTAGAICIDSADLDFNKNKAAVVKLTMADPIVTTKNETDWEATFTFTAEKRKAVEFVVTGTMEIEQETVVADDIEISVRDGGLILEGEEYNKELEIWLNDDVSLVSRIFAGRKYYAYYKEDDTDNKAADIMYEHKDIEKFYQFYTVGLSTATVRFNYDDNLYAYTEDADGNLVYVGRTNNDLPIYSRYYIAAKELNLPVADEPAIDEPVEEPLPVDDPDVNNAIGGGDEVAPSVENNFNPGTGR